MQEIYSYSYLPYTKWATREYAGGDEINLISQKNFYPIVHKSGGKETEAFNVGVER